MYILTKRNFLSWLYIFARKGRKAGRITGDKEGHCIIKMINSTGWYNHLKFFRYFIIQIKNTKRKAIRTKRLKERKPQP